MDLEDLRVLHLAKSKTQHPEKFLDVGSARLTESFQLETCQRWLLVSHRNQKNKLSICSDFPALEVYEGAQAYLFLLRLASGLESEILGETDVFGQVKEAWRKAEVSEELNVRHLGPWMRKIFADTKEIRSRYLQNLGGSSYGTLVRKLIREKGSEKKFSLFLVGAGQLAHSVAPFLLDFPLWFWNRNPQNLAALCDSLTVKSRSTRENEWLILEDESKGWKEAGVIVICTPLDLELDAQRIAWLRQRESEGVIIIHLGGMREHSGAWNSLSGFYCLSDVFDLQNSLNNVRSVQIAQAEKACELKTSFRNTVPCQLNCSGWSNEATTA